MSGDPVELTRCSVRVGTATAVVATDGPGVRLVVAAPGGEIVLPPYGAKHFAEQILRVVREAAHAPDEPPRVPRRSADLPAVTSPWT